jgi:hypothetical protein
LENINKQWAECNQLSLPKSFATLLPWRRPGQRAFVGYGEAEAERIMAEKGKVSVSGSAQSRLAMQVFWSDARGVANWLETGQAQWVF